MPHESDSVARMSIAASELPTDIEALQTMLMATRAERDAAIHLPRLDVTIEPEDTNCPCCRSPMHRIGEETSERLDVVPAQFRVIVTHRPKCLPRL
jgi:transposase